MEKDAEFLDYVVKGLVDHPESVKINRTVDEMGGAWVAYYYMSDEDFKKETDARKAALRPRTQDHEAEGLGPLIAISGDGT